MLIILGLISAALLVTLVAWAAATLARGRRTRRSRVGQHATAGTAAAARAPEPPRPNLLFWLVGALAIGAGLLVVVNGVVQVMEAMDHPDPFGVEGAEAQADAASMVTWGVVILTNGAYVWRGARRRGSQDRLGRVVIIVGYILLGVAMSQAIHSAVDLWAADKPGEDQAVLVETMVRFLWWGVPAALFVFIGTGMADEDILLTAEVNFSS